MNFVTFPECFLLIIEVRVLYRLSTAPNWLWLPGFLAWTKFLDSVLQINDKMCPKILHGRNWSVKLNNPSTPTQKLLSSLSHITVSLKLPKKHPGPDNCHSKLCQKIVTYFVKNLSWLRLRRGWPSDAIFNVWTINAEKPVFCILEHDSFVESSSWAAHLQLDLITFRLDVIFALEKKPCNTRKYGPIWERAFSLACIMLSNNWYYEGVRNVVITQQILGPSISKPDCLFLTDLFAFGKKSGAEKNIDPSQSYGWLKVSARV